MTYENVIEVDTAKERFMGNYEMFSKYLYEFSEGGLLKKLEGALRMEDIPGAFEIAHDMKGVALNLSLKLLETPIFDIVELLRAGKYPGDAEWDLFMSAYRLTIEQIETIKKEEMKLF